MVKHKEKVEKIEVRACSNCNFSEPSFNLLHCSLKDKSVGYSEGCDRWSEIYKKKEVKDIVEDSF